VRKAATAILLVAAATALVAAIMSRSRIGHPVTEPMRQSAHDATGKRLPLDQLIFTRLPGITPAIDQPLPIVLIFIKDDCPCSEAAEPCFQLLHNSHSKNARFIGVIEGDTEVARSWADRHKTPYPVLADPNLEIIRACDAKNSAYAALVLPDGTISRLWPGYSAPMLRELSAQIAALTATNEPPPNMTDAPQTLTSGCPF
jgi:peroxiredoxin